VVAKAIREIEIMCLAGNIPESIDIDIEKLHLGESIRLTEISLPEGSEIPGLTEETDQMVVSINEPRAIEEDPIEEEVELEEGEVAEGDATSEEASENDSSSSDEPSKEDGSEES
jgi:large subunit ribosomal protein L25